MYRFPYTNPRAEKSGWLAFIHAVNTVDIEAGRDRIFGEPVIHETWKGEARVCEEYPDAYVILPLHTLCESGRGDEEGVRIVARTPRAEALFAEIGAAFGFPNPLRGALPQLSETEAEPTTGVYLIGSETKLTLTLAEIDANIKALRDARHRLKQETSPDGLVPQTPSFAITEPAIHTFCNGYIPETQWLQIVEYPAGGLTIQESDQIVSVLDTRAEVGLYQVLKERERARQKAITARGGDTH